MLRAVTHQQDLSEDAVFRPDTTSKDFQSSGDIYSIQSYEVEMKKAPASLHRASVLGKFEGIGYPIKDHLCDVSLENVGNHNYEYDQEYMKRDTYKFNQVLIGRKKKVFQRRYTIKLTM